MPDPNPRRPKPETYHPNPETVALLKISGNPINGVGEIMPRRPSPFFWHPPDQHPWGGLQVAARQSSRKCPAEIWVERPRRKRVMVMRISRLEAICRYSISSVTELG